MPAITESVAAEAPGGIDDDAVAPTVPPLLQATCKGMARGPRPGRGRSSSRGRPSKKSLRLSQRPQPFVKSPEFLEMRKIIVGLLKVKNGVPEDGKLIDLSHEEIDESTVTMSNAHLDKVCGREML